MQRDLRNTVLFVDGLGQVGVVEEGKLPELELDGEEVALGGMAGSIERVHASVKIMETEFTLRDVNRPMMAMLGKPSGPPLVFRSPAKDDQGNVSNIKVTMRGVVKKADLGSLKVKEATMQKFTCTCRFFEYLDGEDVVYRIDPEAGICIVDGVDLMEAERAAMGMGAAAS